LTDKEVAALLFLSPGHPPPEQGKPRPPAARIRPQTGACTRWPGA